MVFMCSQESIDNLPFAKPSSNVQKATAVVMVDGVMVVKLANGRFITSARDVHKWAYPISGDYVFREPIIRGLQKIGAISKADADAHMEEHRRRRAERERRWNEEMFRKCAAELGIDLTAQGIEASGGDGTAPSRSDESPVRKDAP